MKRSSFNLLLSGMVLTAVGIAALQIYWLRSAWELKEEQLNGQIQDALYDTAQSIDKITTSQWITEVRDSSYPRQREVRVIKDSTRNTFITQSNQESQIVIETEEVDGEIIVLTQQLRGEWKSDSLWSDDLLVHIDSADHQTFEINFEQRFDEYEEVIIELMQDEFEGSLSPLELIERTNVDSILTSKLALQGLSLPFNTLISNTSEKDTLEIDSLGTNVFPKVYRTQLFPNALIAKDYQLQLFTTSLNGYVRSEMTGLLLLSFGLLLFMCFVMYVAIRTILKQKKLAAMKSDFMNNMTHEFKTPLATISLATDSISHPSVQGQKAEVDRFLGVIRDENKRLQRQVERVLEIAQIEQSKLQLQHETFEVIPFLNSIVSTTQLLFQPYPNGDFQVELAIEDATCVGDKMHLRNAIVNVLDNAVKYQKKGIGPRVHLSATISNQNLVIQISDEGIGMDSATKTKAFTSFYRATTGLRHDVKGFGIGLSYSKSVLEQHQGSIHIESELGKGTTVNMLIPLT